jgi:secretion/DNA translocation related TadE-like protein
MIWAAAAVGVVEISAVQRRHHATAAADAAALAAAAEGGIDATRACAAARAAAARVGAELIGCVLAGPQATVSVRMPPPPALAWAGAIIARARAGPADTGKPELSRTSPAAS